MKCILGKKVNMTQLFDEKGVVTPVTVVEALPNTVTGIMDATKHGYTAVQLGYGEQKESRVNKAQLGAFANKAYEEVKEFRLADVTVALGDIVAVDSFAAGDEVVVTGTSKGKGFQGVVKRYNFKGGPRSHGQKHSEREGGSIGGGPGRAGGRVVKGMRMPGRTGGDTITVKGLKIMAVDIEKNLLFIKGAVPGRRDTLISIVGKTS